MYKILYANSRLVKSFATRRWTATVHRRRHLHHSSVRPTK